MSRSERFVWGAVALFGSIACFTYIRHYYEKQQHGYNHNKKKKNIEKHEGVDENSTTTSLSSLTFSSTKTRPSSIELIRRYELESHPEGGYYRRIYSCDFQIDKRAINRDTKQIAEWKNMCIPRPLCTSIYFLLECNQRSHLHRIPCDELWYHLAGDAITIITIDDAGTLVQHKLASPSVADAEPFVVVKAGLWFGAYANEDCEYGFVSCVVPGSFFFEEFEMASRVDMLQRFPQHTLLLTDMCIV
jgi:predicted cupin superfamily sugar epimerase